MTANQTRKTKLTTKERKQLKTAFLNQIHPLADALALFEHIPDILFFMKDTKGRITAASTHFAIQMGGTCEEDILGLDAFDLCPKTLAEQYTEDDQQVLKNGISLIEHLELNQRPNGETGWFQTHKLPLHDQQGNIIGLAGITRSLSSSALFLKPFEAFSPAIKYIHEYLGEKISIPELAKRCSLSLNHFERKFKQRFHMPPTQYILQARIHKAQRLLRTTDHRISEIAHEVGFYDQSALTRQFSKAYGTTPSAYRKQLKTVHQNFS